MSQYSKEYLENHDIDWFCYINDKPVHAASNGGPLPNCINDKEQNSQNQISVYAPEHIYTKDDIKTNTRFLNKKFKKLEKDYNSFELSKMKESYLRTFIDMACRGFYSFDRVEKNNNDGNKDYLYIPIAWPKNNSKSLNVQIQPICILDEQDLDKLNSTKPFNFEKLKVKEL